MKIKCAIFDFDGTLFDSMPVWDGVGEIYLRSLGKEPKPGMREDIRALSLDQSARYFQKEYDLTLSTEQIITGVNHIIENFYIYEVLPKPGVREFLEQLKDAQIPMGIVTACDRFLIEAALDRCGMKHYFEKIFTCDEVGHGKDEPVIFQNAMEYFGAERSTTVVFEDAVHAVSTAKADGFTVAAVFDNSEKRQNEIRNLSDCYISNFENTEDFWEFVSVD